MENRVLGRRMRVVRLMRRPQGMPVPGEDLVLDKETELPQEGDLKEGQVLVRNRYLALDPAMRGWMREQKSYIPPVKLGEIMRGSSVGTVLAVHPSVAGLAVGDWVNCNLELGWCEYGIASASKIRKIQADSQIPASVHLGALGGTGLTAYFGLIDVGKPKAGDTVVVSAAAGATGSIVCQIAKHVFGCRVVGIAGGEDKCRWCMEELGVDAMIDYKKVEGSKGFRRELAQACPKGVTIFFDNVGGWILNDTLKHLQHKARVVLCGAISTYNETSLAPGPSAYLNLISTSSRMEGFILLDYAPRYDEAYASISLWLRQGRIKYSEHRVPGLSLAPAALLRLFGKDGGNRGRLIVDLQADA